MSCYFESIPYQRQAGTGTNGINMTQMPKYPAMPMAQAYQQPSPMAPLFPSGPIGTTLPTGVPAGPMMAPIPTSPQPSTTGAAPMIPTTFVPIDTDTTPQTVRDIYYTAGFLRSQIGRRMRVEFLIGTGALIDRTGTLVGVGASYILLQLVDSDDIMMCDLYSIKFATIFF